MDERPPQTQRQLPNNAMAAVTFARTAARRVAVVATRAVHTEAKIAALGLELPPPGAAQANYILATRSGDLVFTGAESRPCHPAKHPVHWETLICVHSWAPANEA